MAEEKPKGSILYEVLIVILAGALVGTILYPKHLWEKEDRNRKACRENLVSLTYAEFVYLKERGKYTDNLDSLEALIAGDPTKQRLREFIKMDSSLAEQTIRMLIRRDTLAAAIEDTVREFCRLNDKENPWAWILDSLYTYPKFANFVDSVALSRVLVMRTCPTVNRPYHVTVVDTGVVKQFVIHCPITREDSLKVENDFLLSTIGGLRISNHGSSKTGEYSWKHQ
ncbi:MAG: hypothetical protein ONB23_03490 [candidate division KSB1 bacterium]|nr:hypothetical protein [candidate division KSB1 bacterium]